MFCRISPFAASGEWGDWSGDELIYQASAGVMFENGDPASPPLYGVGHRASYAAGVIAYTECVALLLGPDRREHTEVDGCIALIV